MSVRQSTKSSSITVRSRLIGVLSLPWAFKHALRIAVDCALLLGSFLMAMGFRYDSFFFISDPRPWTAFGITLPITICTFAATGLYNGTARHLSARTVAAIAKGVLLSGACLFVLSQTFILAVPRSVPAIYSLFGFFTVGGLRILLSELLRSELRNGREPVMVYGAGPSGQQLVASLLRGSEYFPIALIDDDPFIEGSEVHGLRVIGPQEIPELIEHFGVNLVLLALPNVARSRRHKIIEHLTEMNLRVRSVPSLQDIIADRARTADIVDVSEEDVLGRDPAPQLPDLMTLNIRGKAIMVTGAGGLLGSELCRQILGAYPTDLILFEHTEPSLYRVQMEITTLAATMASPPRIHAVLGSTQSRRRLDQVFHRIEVDTVFHAAAYSLTPVGDENITEVVRNNVFGTVAVLEAAISAGVSSFCLISTDMPVQSDKLMEASRRLSEVVCSTHAREQSRTRISIVRFGGLLGQPGAVTSVLRKQIISGGPINVAHPDQTRYLMPASEAAQLIIQGNALAGAGEILHLDMGDPVLVLDLAKRMARLHGLRPYIEGTTNGRGDIAIRIAGLRTGEELHETRTKLDHLEPTAHPRIFRSASSQVTFQQLSRLLHDLERALAEADTKRLADLLAQADGK